MNKYQYLKKNKDNINDLIHKGFISISVSLHMQLYEFFKKQKGGKMDRYSKTAVEFNLSERTVRKVISDFESKL